MCGCFCIKFIGFVLEGKRLFSPNEYEKNDKIILKIFTNENAKMKKLYCVILLRKFESPKIS